MLYQKLPPDFEGNFNNLLNEDTYFVEARKLKKLGIERAGCFGAVCPVCFMEVLISEVDAAHATKLNCHCPDQPRESSVEIAQKHGFQATRVHIVAAII